MENLYLIFHTWSNYEMNFLWNIVRRSPPTVLSYRSPVESSGYSTGPLSAFQHFRFQLFLLSDLLSSGASRQAGPLAKREGDVFSESRESSLVKGFENAAPARPAGHRPALLPYPC
jgi:hypothetical protein